MCGIVGISAETNIAAEIYDSLLMLQHRGQDAAGMVVCDSQDRLHSRKSMGYVRDVFQQRHMSKLIGNYGIGHVDNTALNNLIVSTGVSGMLSISRSRLVRRMRLYRGSGGVFGRVRTFHNCSM